MSLKTIQNKNTRRGILKLLAKTANQSAVDYELLQAIEISEGLRPTFDDFAEQLEWLNKNGLVILEGSVINTVTLTRAGLDVAEYRTSFGGVAKKRPGV